MPLCLGTRYRNLDHLDLLTPNRLIHGRANKRALSGCCMIDKPSAMLEKMHEVFEAWWQAWSEEKLVDFVASPIKKGRTTQVAKVGDIVIFQKTGAEQVLGEPIWRIGRIVAVEESEKDGQVRTATIEYRNSSENVFRETRRAVRQLAVIYREDELELVQELNAAARAADRASASGSLYVEQQAAVLRDVQRCESCVEPFMCQLHYSYFVSRPFVAGAGSEPAEEPAVCSSQLCEVFRIHEGVW